MVITQGFQDLFEVASKIKFINLPTIKQTALKIEFEGDSLTENNDGYETVYDGEEPLLPFANSAVFHANIFDWRRLTAVDGDCKNVYEVTFDSEESNFMYRPGDTIGIIPQNNPMEVDTVLSHLDLISQADIPYTLSCDKTVKGVKVPVHVPVKSTLRHVFTHCLDLRNVIKKLFILALSRHTKDEKERKALEYICRKEGSLTYTKHILNQNICILDIFSIFKTCKPPIEVLLANLSRLLPRPYSIVNSPTKEPNVLKICFSVMVIGNNRKGLVTGWMEDLILGAENNLEDSINNLSINERNSRMLNRKIPIYLRKNISGFSSPEKLESHLLLIGAGSGVAPYIGFLQERESLNAELNIGETWLIFGCRNPKQDFIYENELNEFVNNRTLCKLSTAFSREENCENKYIQDTIQNNSQEITKFIKKGAFIYVCGDLKTMARQIKESLVTCLVQHDGQSKEEAEIYISDLQKEKRYLIDQWC